MKLNEIIKIANEGYPDGYLAVYWDFKNECILDKEGGDTLALFIVRELQDTYDPKLNDKQQLSEARIAIDNAIDSLMDVGDQLDLAMDDKDESL